MKGWGGDLWFWIIIIAIVFIFSILALQFGSTGFGAFGCEQQMTGQVQKWIDSKLDQPGAQQFTDKLSIADCVDYIATGSAENGIKFKGSSKIVTFNLGEVKGNRQVVFTSTVDKVYPRGDPYDVTITPPNTINIVVS